MPRLLLSACAFFLLLAPATSQDSKPRPNEFVAKEGLAACRLGEVSVIVGYGGVDRVVAKFVDERRSIDDFLKFSVAIQNGSDVKKLDYQGWCRLFGGAAEVRDDLGNRYRQAHFGAAAIVGQIDATSIYPGKTAFDLLVFEQPVAKATELILELPAKNIGGSGILVFRFPKASWVVANPGGEKAQALTRPPETDDERKRREAEEAAQAKKEVEWRAMVEADRLEKAKKETAAREAKKKAEDERAIKAMEAISAAAAEAREADAARRLRLAKQYLVNDLPADAVPVLIELLTRHPQAKVADEAAELLVKLESKLAGTEAGKKAKEFLARHKKPAP